MAIEHRPPAEFHIASHDTLYFVAGPIQGAPDWQKEAFYHIDSLAPRTGTHVANPRRELIDIDFDYDEQVSWEKRGLWRAAKHGGILVWLAAQDHSLSYKEGRAYGQTTRFEFARAIGWRDYDPFVHVSIGIEPGYDGSERYYRHAAAESGLPVHSTLEEACNYLVRTR